jgi:copper chaperone CopZ
MSCSFCVASITKALEQPDGVQEASVNLAHEGALITYDPQQVTPTQKEILRDLDYTVIFGADWHILTICRLDSVV